MTAFLRFGLVAALGFAALSACGVPTSRALPGATPRAHTLRASGLQQTGHTVTAHASVNVNATTSTAGEGVLRLVARVPNGHWGVKDREAVTVRVWLNGVYNQDIVLYAGAREHTYAVALGALEAGQQALRFDWYAPGAARGLQAAEILGTELSVVPAGADDYEVLRRTPIIYGRSDAHVSDTPILMMYEQHPMATGRSIRYTPVFSNEDGGTATHALWARWGRTLDIDWCYQVDLNDQGQPQRETYQGQWHRTRTFKGLYESAHPFLRVATDNNCFHDQGDSPFRFRPLPTFRLDPSRTAREEILDLNPWSYGLAAAELVREGKATPAQGGDVKPAPRAASRVGDSRHFVVIEFHQVNRGRGVGTAVKIKGDPQIYLSNRGQQGLQAGRTGWCRVAVELPRRVTAEEIDSISLWGQGRGEADISQVRKVLAFDEAYMPRVLPFQWRGSATLKGNSDRLTMVNPQTDQPAPSIPAAGL